MIISVALCAVVVLATALGMTLLANYVNLYYGAISAIALTVLMLLTGLNVWQIREMASADRRQLIKAQASYVEATFAEEKTGSSSSR